MFFQGQVIFEPSSTAEPPIDSGIVNVTGLWPGVAVLAIHQRPVGFNLQLAADIASISSFTVTTSSMAVSRSASVPTADRGMGCEFASLGSGVKVVLQCLSSLLPALQDQAAIPQLSWDFANQRVVPYDADVGALPVRVVELLQDAYVIGCGRLGGLSWKTSTALIVRL